MKAIILFVIAVTVCSCSQFPKSKNTLREVASTDKDNRTWNERVIAGPDDPALKSLVGNDYLREKLRVDFCYESILTGAFRVESPDKVSGEQLVGLYESTDGSGGVLPFKKIKTATHLMECFEKHGFPTVSVEKLAEKIDSPEIRQSEGKYVRVMHLVQAIFDLR